ncbi:RNA-binding (RRM/RBD/RNP motifs) family protein, partial [Striga asiatica]
MMSSGSVVRMKLGKSRSLMPFIPGTHSNSVSSHEATSARGKENELWNIKLFSSIKREAHDPVRDYASDGRAIGGAVEVLNELQKRGKAVFGEGVAKLSPSGMARNWKPGRPNKDSGPRARRSLLWLNSVLTKVMKKPLEWRSLASFRTGAMWPCA